MSRAHAVHWLPPAVESWCVTTCGRLVEVYPYVKYVSVDAGANVTCRVCLYHLGLYVPLVKLRQHQWMASGSALPLSHWSRVWGALRRNGAPNTGFDKYGRLYVTNVNRDTFYD